MCDIQMNPIKTYTYGIQYMPLRGLGQVVKLTPCNGFGYLKILVPKISYKSYDMVTGIYMNVYLQKIKEDNIYMYTKMLHSDSDIYFESATDGQGIVYAVYFYFLKAYDEDICPDITAEV
jgi:hypothetical protein